MQISLHSSMFPFFVKPKKQLLVLTLAGTLTFLACHEPIGIAITSTINELFTLASFLVVKISSKRCPAVSAVFLKGTSIRN